MECCRHCAHHLLLLRPHAAPTSSPTLPPCALRHVSLPLWSCVFPPLPRGNDADVSLATGHWPRSPSSHALCFVSNPTHPPALLLHRLLQLLEETGELWYAIQHLSFVSCFLRPVSIKGVERVSLLPIFGDRFFDTLFPAMPTSLDHKISRPVVRMNRRRRRRLPLLKRSRICYDIDGRRKQSPATAAVASGAVKERLQALRKLIPRKTDSVKEKEMATDRIFEETAEYILLLRAQVEVLKLLVDFHSPCTEKNGGMQ
ncbi:unnamed protein product [Musa hybrid cultivar]